jgi:hypothetical protein
MQPRPLDVNKDRVDSEATALAQRSEGFFSITAIEGERTGAGE